MKCSFHTHGCGLSLKIGDILLVDAGESIFFRCIWFVSVRRLDEHGNRGCKVGYVKVIADRIPLVGNRVGIVKSMHKRKGDIITSFRTQGTSKVTIPPRTVSENGQKNGITLELAYCAHDYAIITLLDGGIPAYRPNGPYNEGPDDPSEGLPPSDDSSDDEWNKKPPPKKRKGTDISAKEKKKKVAKNSGAKGSVTKGSKSNEKKGGAKKSGATKTSTKDSSGNK